MDEFSSARGRLAGGPLGHEVSDNGPGIAPEIAALVIFDPFFHHQAAGALEPAWVLSIVYGIVQEHGGEVSVDSLPKPRRHCDRRTPRSLRFWTRSGGGTASRPIWDGRPWRLPMFCTARRLGERILIVEG